MARETKRLSARAVSTISKPGMHADGDGLYLVVDPKGAKRWSFIFQWQGKRREMGLGKLSAIGLADAREKAAEARRLLADGQDPIAARRAAIAEREAGQVTFGSFADELVAGMESQFRNEKHKYQWRRTLEVYAAPLRPKRLDEIDTQAVLEVLTPLWSTKQETASRLRGRIERVLDAAKVKGLRSGENPARWRGHLDKILPKRRKLQRGHHPALPYSEVPKFLKTLEGHEGMGATALRFVILTAVRSGDAIGAKWSELNFKTSVWTVPAERMKAGREHRVPLTDAALAILEKLKETSASEFIFTGTKKKPISNMTMLKALRTAGAKEFTVHGFRSSFRDWVSEETNFPSELAEAALAHIIGDETERAYRRGDALEKRRKLMLAWERFCLGSGRGNVVAMRARA